MNGPEAAMGQWFMEALNEGLNRSVVHTRRRTAPDGDVPRDPFAAAVMRRFETSLPTVLGAPDRTDAALLAVLHRRARHILARALAPAGPADPRGSAPPHPPLPARLEALVPAVLLECAALLLMEPAWSERPDRKPADVLRAMGEAVREPLIPDTAGKTHVTWITGMSG
ncbi:MULTISPECIES: hypothetical protein [unclassified Streptomyces]|uniref:hypothetical protein n=1 Tax=unclassified Streptomyces TaxID=2593676 RepID=UPI0033AFF9DC